jgi:L-alanine-DL-glutamate epimerase-like enolase superfamily enzyme
VTLVTRNGSAQRTLDSLEAVARPGGELTIESVEATDLELPYPSGFRPAWRPGLISHGRRFTFVAVRTRQGLVGYAGTDGHHAAVIERDVAPYLVGEPVSATERHARVFRNAGGMWFVDLALWDLMGKAADLPLYRMWGWARDSVPAYASTCSLGTPEDRAGLARHYRDGGYRAMKLRFHHHDMRDDLASLDAAMAAAPDLTFMVDANQATELSAPEESPKWDYRRALATARALEERGVLWLEEPLARYDFAGLARLCRETTVYIAGGEYNRGLHEFRWLIEREVYDIVQADSTVSEGISQLRKVAAMAEMCERHFIPHHGLSGLGLAAQIHLACGTPGMSWIEMMYEPSSRTYEAYQELGGILETGIRVHPDGRVRPPDGAGLGIAVNEQKIAEYAA